MGVCCSNSNLEYDEDIHKIKTLDELIVLIRNKRKEYIYENCKIKEYMINSNKHKEFFKVSYAFM